MATYNQSQMTLPSGDVVKFIDNTSGYTKNTGTVTSVATGVGLTGGTITGSGTIKAKLKSETASTLTAADKGSTASREYAVGVDASGNLSVNVPWTDNNTTYSSGTGISISGTTINHSNSVTSGTAGTSSATSGNSLAVPYVTYDAQGHITAAGTHTHTITNNITGSGTNNYIAKFNGSNTITNGPAFGSSTTTFLRNDGSWAAPSASGTMSYTTCTLPKFSAAGSSNVAISGMTASNHAILDVYVDTAANASAIQSDWSHIYRADTYAGGITFYSDGATSAARTVLVSYY